MMPWTQECNADGTCVVALIPWSNTGQRQQHLPAPSDSKFLPLQGFFISFAVARVQKLHPGAMRPKPPAVVGRGPSLFSWSKERILAARVKWCQGKFDRFRQDKLGYLYFGSAALIQLDAYILNILTIVAFPWLKISVQFGLTLKPSSSSS